MKWLFNKSKWIHKYFGLLLILFLIWMSLSGILLNHPKLISRFSVPAWAVPPQYRIDNWNRSALVTLQFSKKNPGTGFAAGKLGVWKTEDGGNSFSALQDGLPDSDFYRKTSSLQLIEGDRDILLAATDGGLYQYRWETGSWFFVPLGEEVEKVVKIIQVKDRLAVFTLSGAFESSMEKETLVFNRLPLQRRAEENRVSLVRLFFHLHNGHIWGLAGRLLFDLVGLAIIFLSSASFYIWYFPWRRKKRRNPGKTDWHKIRQTIFKFSFKYHLHIGIWAASLLLIMGVTGFFMRPPPLAIIAHGSIPGYFYPGHLPENPWDEKIHNAMYYPATDEIIIEATDGFWAAPADFGKPFEKRAIPLSVFVMGATVLEPYPDGGFLVGSFNGLFQVNPENSTTTDILTGKTVFKPVSSVSPADTMVTGYFRMPDGTEYLTAHHQGILPIGTQKNQFRLEMPPEIKNNYRMPLWNFMFELHNGRIFKDLIGGIYILLVPLGSLLFCLIILSGIYDWLYLKIFRKKGKA